MRDLTNFFQQPSLLLDRDSSIGIASLYGLDGPVIESQLRARFSTPVQTGPGAHQASSTIHAKSLFRA